MRRTPLVLVLAVIACGKKAEDGTKETKEREHAKAALREALKSPALRGPGQAVAVQPLPPSTDGPGPAYLWISHVGLATIDKGAATLTRLADPDRLGLHVTAMAFDGRGPVGISSSSVFRIADGAREELGRVYDVIDGPPEIIAIAPDGTVWIGSDKGIAHRTDGAWRREEVEIADLESIDFDGAGHVFVTGRNDVKVLDGGVWKMVLATKDVPVEGAGTKPWWHQTVVTPKGEIWVLGCFHMLRLTGGDVTVSDLPEPGFGHGRFVGGTLVGESCMTNTLVNVSATGTLTEVKPAPRTEGYAKAVDGRGRLWVSGKREGVTIISPDGSRVSWPIGSMAAISGDVAAVAVAGTGPDVLPAVTPGLTAMLTGFVLDGGKPVERAEVELCRQPMVPSPSPCSDDPGRLTGWTDATGAFFIRSPLRPMELTAKVNGHWYQLMNHECTGVEPGATCTIGTIELTKAVNPTEPLGTRYVSNPEDN